MFEDFFFQIKIDNSEEKIYTSTLSKINRRHSDRLNIALKSHYSLYTRIFKKIVAAFFMNDRCYANVGTVFCFLSSPELYPTPNLSNIQNRTGQEKKIAGNHVDFQFRHIYFLSFVPYISEIDVSISVPQLDSIPSRHVFVTNCSLVFSVFKCDLHLFFVHAVTLVTERSFASSYVQ